MQTFYDLYRYRFILGNLVAKEVKILYRNMALGVFWSVLNPLVMVGVLSYVWITFFGASKDFPVFVIIGLVAFNYFSYCLNGCTTSIVANAPIVKKVAFPRQILPVSVVITHLVDLAAQFGLLLLLVVLLPTPGKILTWNLLWIPPIFVILIGLCLGCGFLVSALNVKYRDMKYIVESFLTVFFWLCPILYPAAEKLSRKPLWVKAAYYINPLSGIIDSFRNVLYHGRRPDFMILSLALVVTLVVGAVGVRVFWMHEKDFADYL